jgi:hypothetical protein
MTSSDWVSSVEWLIKNLLTQVRGNDIAVDTSIRTFATIVETLHATSLLLKGLTAMSQPF